jgi:hypothetical protein
MMGGSGQGGNPNVNGGQLGQMANPQTKDPMQNLNRQGAPNFKGPVEKPAQQPYQFKPRPAQQPGPQGGGYASMPMPWSGPPQGMGGGGQGIDPRLATFLQQMQGAGRGGQNSIPGNGYPAQPTGGGK